MCGAVRGWRRLCRADATRAALEPEVLKWRQYEADLAGFEERRGAFLRQAAPAPCAAPHLMTNVREGTHVSAVFLRRYSSPSSCSCFEPQSIMSSIESNCRQRDLFGQEHGVEGFSGLPERSSSTLLQPLVVADRSQSKALTLKVVEAESQSSRAVEALAAAQAEASELASKAAGIANLRAGATAALQSAKRQCQSLTKQVLATGFHFGVLYPMT